MSQGRVHLGKRERRRGFSHVRALSLRRNRDARNAFQKNVRGTQIAGFTCAAIPVSDPGTACFFHPPAPCWVFLNSVTELPLQGDVN